MKESNIKRTILISVLSSVIVLVFIKPILDFLWKLIFWLSTNFYQNLLDIVYKNAALGHRDWVSVILLFIAITIVTVPPFAALTVQVLRPLFSKSRKRKKAKSNNVFLKRILVGLGFIFSLIIVFLLIFIIVSVYVDLQLNASFNQRLAVLSPKIGDVESKNLQARWAMMESRKDYENIVSEMENLAVKHEIKLPKLLID